MHAEELEPRLCCNGVATILRAFNDVRAARHEAPLRVEVHLQRVAVERVTTEAWDGVYSGDAGFPFDLETSGYPWRALGENDGYNWGFPDPVRELLIQWWQSPPHRANILDPVFRDVGIGIATGENGTTFGVVALGRHW